MKKAFYIIIVFLVAIYASSSNCVYAVDTDHSQSSQKQSEKLLTNTKDSSEQKEVKKSLKEYVRNAENNTEDSENLMSSEASVEEEDYNFAKSYRVQLMNNFFITDYWETGNITDCISDTVQWKVPYVRKNGDCGIATFAEQDDSFAWIGESQGSIREEIPQSEKVIAKKIENDNSLTEDINTVQYIYSQMYQLVIIYITTDSQEYMIPYAEFPSQLESTDGQHTIVNGKIYELHNFMKEMNEIFDESYLKEHPDESMGLPYRQTSKVSFSVLGICIVSVLVIAAIIIVVFQKMFLRRQIQ